MFPDSPNACAKAPVSPEDGGTSTNRFRHERCQAQPVEYQSMHTPRFLTRTRSQAREQPSKTSSERNCWASHVMGNAVDDRIGPRVYCETSEKDNERKVLTDFSWDNKDRKPQRGGCSCAVTAIFQTDKRRRRLSRKEHCVT